MIKAKLTTTTGVYSLELKGCESLEDGLEHVIHVLDHDKVFYGDSYILQLGSDVAVLAIEIAEIATVEIDQPVEGAKAGDALGLTQGVLRMEVLGQTLMVAYAAFNIPGHTYLIVSAINGDSPFNSLGLSKLVELTRQVAAANYVEGATAVVPPMQLADEEDYIEYLKDYVAEAVAGTKALESKNDDAKAWTGWREGANNE